MSETIKISVKLAGKVFPLTIQREDEEKYRKAATEINNLINAYKKRFRAEPEDYMSMAALQTAVDKVGLEMTRELSPQMSELEQIENEIDSYLNNIKE